MKPFMLFILCSFGAILNSFLGGSFGYGLMKCFYAFLGFVGLQYISKYRINTFVFIPFFIIMYLFFYYKYFIYSESTRLLIDSDLFGKSSSNTIAMSLNISLFVYLMVSHKQTESHNWLFIGIALINLYLINIQGSRAGVLVAFLFFVYTIINALGSGLNTKLRYVIPLIVVFIFLYQYQSFLWGYAIERRMDGMSAFEENVRYFAQVSFFQNMNFTHFFFGYPKDYNFVVDITRTFNSFLDLWSRSGVVPLFYLLYCLIVRLVKYKFFSVPVLLLIPFLAYAPFESLWGCTLWDICIFLSLFYSYNKTET